MKIIIRDILKASDVIGKDVLTTCLNEKEYSLQNNLMSTSVSQLLEQVKNVHILMVPAPPGFCCSWSIHFKLYFMWNYIKAQL